LHYSVDGRRFVANAEKEKEEEEEEGVRTEETNCK
jgi:hypothetical protein